MMWLCNNCLVPMAEINTEDRRCPTCGLLMEQVHVTDPSLHDIEFDHLLTALLYGKKP